MTHDAEVQRPSESDAIVLRRIDLENLVTEAFRSGEHNFYERASALLPVLQMHRGVEDSAITIFEGYLRDCDRAPRKSMRLMRLIRRVVGNAGGGT